MKTFKDKTSLIYILLFLSSPSLANICQEPLFVKAWGPSPLISLTTLTSSGEIFHLQST